MNLLFYAVIFLSFVFVVFLIGISLAGFAYLWDKYAKKTRK